MLTLRMASALCEKDLLIVGVGLISAVVIERLLFIVELQLVAFDFSKFPFEILQINGRAKHTF